MVALISWGKMKQIVVEHEKQIREIEERLRKEQLRKINELAKTIQEVSPSILLVGSLGRR